MERRVENEAERLALMKKLSLSCMTNNEEEAMRNEEEEMDEELNEVCMHSLEVS